MENLTLEQVKQYLKENLRISIDIKRDKSDFYNSNCNSIINIKIFLDEDLIDESEDLI